MSSRPELKLDWCSHEAAKYAVEHWHYSKSMPPSPHVRVGAWESGQFIGVILFARGANKNLGKPFGLSQLECAELVRVALASHQTPVSRIVAIATRMMQKQCPGLRCVISFADPYQGHRGGIYQAGNWIYVGRSKPSNVFVDRSGREWHPRTVSETGQKRVFGKIRSVVKTCECDRKMRPGKHRYLMPLDPEMRARVQHLAKPYPKRAGTIGSDGPSVQAG